MAISKEYRLIHTHAIKDAPIQLSHIMWSDDQRIAILLNKGICVIDIYNGGWSQSDVINPSELAVFGPDVTKVKLDGATKYYLLQDSFITVYKPLRDNYKIGFLKIYWSPCAISSNGSCILSAITANHRLLLYQSQMESHCLTKWNLTADVTFIYHRYLEEDNYFSRFDKLSDLTDCELICYKAAMICTTSAAWCKKVLNTQVKSGILLMCTKSGDIVLVNVSSDSTSIECVVPVINEFEDNKSCSEDRCITDVAVSTDILTNGRNIVTVIVACGGNIHVILLSNLYSNDGIEVVCRERLPGQHTPRSCITNILSSFHSVGLHGDELIIVGCQFVTFHVYHCHVDPERGVTVLQYVTVESHHSMLVTCSWTHHSSHDITTVSQDGSINTLKCAMQSNAALGTECMKCEVVRVESPIAAGFSCAAGALSPTTNTILITLQVPHVMYDHLSHPHGRNPCLVQVYEHVTCGSVVQNGIRVMCSSPQETPLLPYYDILLWWRLVCHAYKPATYPPPISHYVQNYTTLTDIRLLKLTRLFIILQRQSVDVSEFSCAMMNAELVVRDISGVLLWHHMLRVARTFLQSPRTDDAGGAVARMCRWIDECGMWSRCVEEPSLRRLGEQTASQCASPEVEERCVYCEQRVAQSPPHLACQVKCHRGHVTARCARTFILIPPRRVIACSMCSAQYMDSNRGNTCIFCDNYLR